jgi:hypothetical protein
MKKHINTLLSLGSYVVALICYFCLLYIPNISPSAVYVPTLILLVVGIFFGFRSIKAKESAWAGHLMVVIGGLIIISPLLIVVIGYRI